MLGENEQPQINLAGFDAGSNRKRHGRVLIAFVLVLAAVAVFVMKYRPYWLDSLSFEEARNQPASEVTKTSEPPAKHVKSRKSANQHTPPVSEAQPAESSEQADVVIAPLRVDVTYSSGQHETLLARNSAIRVDMDRDPGQAVAMPAPAPETGVVQAAERVRYSDQAMEVVVRPVEPVYPLLAQQSHVQGSVVLHARVSKDGTVQALKVISGPDILTTAALEAVKQWRFKPHYESGEAVPTETHITVNFTISTP
jgi:TonB family protein